MQAPLADCQSRKPAGRQVLRAGHQTRKLAARLALQAGRQSQTPAARRALQAGCQSQTQAGKPVRRQTPTLPGPGQRRGVREVAPFGGWTYVPQFWFQERALLVVVLSFALVIAVLVVPAAWRLGNELHTWAAAYIVYIAAVVEPGSSLARFLLPQPPATGPSTDG